MMVKISIGPLFAIQHSHLHTSKKPKTLTSSATNRQLVVPIWLLRGLLGVEPPQDDTRQAVVSYLSAF